MERKRDENPGPCADSGRVVHGRARHVGRRDLSDSFAALQTVQGQSLLGARLRLLPWTATLFVTA